jgi:hypothetical protein
MLNRIQAIAIDWRYLEPQNLLLIILILATVGISVSILLERRNIPRLVFGHIWKQNDRIIPTAINYFLKIKRENGEGGVQGFRGFVGVKDKFDPKVSHFLLSKN